MRDTVDHLTTTSKDKIVRRVAFALQLLENVFDRLHIHPVALDESHVFIEDFEAFIIDVPTEFSVQDFQQALEHFERIACEREKNPRFDIECTVSNQ